MIHTQKFCWPIFAENQNQVMTQVNRVIQYEKNPVISEAYLISWSWSSEGPGEMVNGSTFKNIRSF